MIKGSTIHLTNLKVETSYNLVTDFAGPYGLTVIVKGLRTSTDFNHELQMVHINKHLSEIDTFL